MNTSPLCELVAKEDLARAMNSFNINYNDTGIFGIYTECDKEKIPQLMETVMNVILNVGLHVVISFVERYNYGRTSRSC